jgi:uncharacterized protein (TIGR03437 family)
MNRLALFVLLSLSGLCLKAQNGQSSITISTDPSGARFTVDDQIYYKAATFLWPAGSKHTLVFILDTPPIGQTTAPRVQTSLDGGTIYAFSGWQDNASLITPTQDPIQVITADPHITSISAKLTLTYRVFLNYFASQDPTLPVTCGAPGAIPQGQFRPGIVYVNGQCFWASAAVFVPANSTIILNAFPYPGFVFLGWTSDNYSLDYLTTIKVTSAISIEPRFSPAKRVQFVTSPPGLSVLIDRSVVPTRQNGDVTVPCTEFQPFPTQAGFPTLCWGDFDFAPGSAHTIAGVSPSEDTHGKLWIYDSWSSSAGQKGAGQSTYTADNTSSTDVATVKFVPAGFVGFLTNPPGLQLTVDGRSNYPEYNFYWGLGTTHQVSATAVQFDKKGRQYTFKGWSNGGGASQTVTVGQEAVDNGVRITANYSVLSRVMVQSSPSGLSVQVDGTTCQTPCTIDRPNGSQLRVTAPTTISQGDTARLDLLSWTDGGASDHSFAVTADFTTISATYRASYRLSAASDPGNGVNFQFDPSSPDMFYPQDTQVAITTTANAGFKFRRWGGDLAGTYPSASLTMSSPHSVLALLDRVPYIAPAGVRNAVGDTPSSAVAAGSLITIFGESLAPVLEVGRVNPLAQTIAGVTVTVNDRILPLLYVSPGQINAEVPSDLPAGNYTLQVHSQGQPDVSGVFTVVRNAPGLFSWTLNSQQYALAFHADGSPVNPDSPAKAGETVSLLGTGFGPYSGFLIDGFFPPDPPPALSDQLGISAGGQTPATSFVGAAPGYSGVTLTKFQVPDGMPSGATVPVTVNVNGVASNTVMLPLL